MKYVQILHFKEYHVFFLKQKAWLICNWVKSDFKFHNKYNWLLYILYKWTLDLKFSNVELNAGNGIIYTNERAGFCCIESQ